MTNRNSNSHTSPSVQPPRIPIDYRNLFRSAILVVFACFVVFVFDYHCPFQAIFSLPCPGCGMTRALIALLQGHLALSIQWHFMLIPSLFLLGLYLVLRLKKKESLKTWQNLILYTWVFLMLIYWIWRLIFVFPSSPLF